ncbi:MATE family multidrug resistance protein [Roseibium hamelinense]|uniref:Multidrug-efflux transporter n=1 Tax=Roseibium hamelinense TaxID=150831 RepID=A0A562SM22_9HYPH|nr:MATE family efflux transporter [Roseibium hamelinense]MTI45028.1 MATE family efflux transporter [Roseibium hamelinense]TWI82292.1 MATE family multidrug resistance protein [Roseibium hamelinense]
MAGVVTTPHGNKHRGLWNSDVKPTLALGLPLAGAQIAQIAINTTDVIMIGRLGAEPLAAAVLAFNLYILTWFFGMGILQAVIPLAAHARGQKNVREVRRCVRMGFWIVVVYCLPFWILLSFTTEILIALKQDPEISRLAGQYMDVLMWTLMPALGIMAVRGFLTVMERAQIVLYATIAGAIANAILDYLLIFGNLGFPRLELIGAGIASVVSSTVTMLLLFAYASMHPKLRRYYIFGRIWRMDWPVFFQIIRLGWPIGVTIVAEAGLFAASSILMGWLGTIPLAAHGIAVQIASVTFMVPVGMSQAAMTRVGLAAGRRDRSAIGRAGWTALAITLGFMGCFAILFWTVPEFLVALYLDFGNPQSQAVLTLASTYLFVAAIFQLADGAQIIGVNNLRGLGDTTVPLYYALFGYWVVGISLSLGLGFAAGLEGIGIWCGLAGGLATVAVLANRRFYQREKLKLIRF